MKPEIWPVIHVRDPKTSVENAMIADGCGCAGVFLIQMEGLNYQILHNAEAIRAAMRTSGLKIGANFLGVPINDALRRSRHRAYDATWCDNGGIYHGAANTDAVSARGILRGMPNHKLFAGVDFKGQRRDKLRAESAALAHDFGFIPTTSGEGTGIAPDVEKILNICEGIGPDKPLAIASGVTPLNVMMFAPHVSYVLVATGISRNFHVFEPALLQALVDNINGAAR